MRARQSLIGWGLLVLVLAFAALAPLADAVGPLRQNLMRVLAGPDALAPFGYDHLGRSMMARLAHGLRLSLMIALATAATAAAVGIALGTLAACWTAPRPRSREVNSSASRSCGRCCSIR
ncbi:hypothetical protein ORIO_17820 [Cereibacter azotoformans]|uniref:hypothetical protein n=1 Tax=Cereibacter azotoformans TaxID=43057 RepID=UPI001EEC5554|nr:hypothetical protein [Cereibacter azotoformans]ULB11718.1 hypothetical protein ORIO_17820 [Cereibacter azotoformans]